MRIAQLSKDSSQNGGVGTYVVGVGRALVAAGHQVALIHSDTGGSQSSGEMERYRVENFDQFGGAQSDARTKRVIEVLTGWQPDVVLIQGNNNFPLEFEIRRRFAAVKFLHVHDYCPSGNKFHHATSTACQYPTGSLCLFRMAFCRCTLSKRPSAIWQMYRRCIASNRNNAEFDRLIVGSNYVKDQAIASGYLPAQIEVLPYFTELPAEVSAPQDSRMILFMGRIEREKGLSYLLEAVSRMQTSWKLVIAGDGGDLAWAKRRVFELRLTDRTEFVGWVQSEGRSSLFEECSVVAIPSIWPEPFGLVGIEAMSHARPVVAFRVGGIPDWLEDGRTGYAVPPNDVQQMASRLSYLLEHPTVVWEMGRCGRQSVEQRFCSDRHITHLIEILGRAVADAASVGSDGGSVRHVGSSLGSV